MRNFFYNKGDVLIAILIIMAAAVVIYMRIGVIMDYSASGENTGGRFPFQTLFGWMDKSKPDAENGKDGDGSGTAGTDAPDSSGAGSDAGNGAGAGSDPGIDSGADPGADPDSGSVSGRPLPPQEQPSGEDGSVKFNISSGDTASEIADRLYEAGLITDADDFLYEAAAMGVDSDFKIGSFSIPSGSSVREIIEILTGWP